MEPQDEKKDEQQIAAMLAASESDAPPPNKELLETLRGQSSAAFASSTQRKPLFHKRWLAAAAAFVFVAVGLYFWLISGPSGVALGQVLENTEKAAGLQIRITRDNEDRHLWHTSTPNRWRLDNTDGSYVIVDEKNLWLVNEKTNEARRSALLKSDQVRLANYAMKSLGLPEDDPAFLNARPVERVRTGDGDILYYRFKAPEIDSTKPVAEQIPSFFFEARVDATTRRLQSLDVWRDENHLQRFAQLKVLSYEEPIAAEKFAIADTLTEDGRIGKVADVQGIVAVKPVMHERWTPVREHLVLKPGDWLRTDARGANAAALKLVKNTGVILGPHTLVELIGPKQIRLIEGVIEINASAQVELLGPDKQTFPVKGRQLFRVDKQTVARVAKDPAWLAGFKGATTNEALGSLVALVDGRNVPLTVGYHKVQVDIRDQIARTVIEESFVNHTDAVLEGVFHFPLPPDASISGFGMWIGDNLVEADVVEKQRAREIYETILREKRDPGLLEWSGGNIFKARVYPIPARSEKRIKITYTQVLPLKGSRYRYSYALQSELLQQHPLRSLNIDVKVNSAAPLKSVSSPTHPTREDKTTHSGHVEFSAQEYTPTRDFEVVVEVENRGADVVVIPHRRGDDGYFLMQLMPPGADGNWERPILPNGDPLNLLILADTSASIDNAQRATQATFIASLLNSLTPKDTFNLATCDVQTDWAFKDASPANADNVSAAREFLARRASLGWTDLDRTFAAALKRATPKTHVIYVGDGIVTTGDADPVDFTKRLRRLVLPSPPGREAGGEGPTFHAITLGSSFEAGVLKTIASLGGGSMRKITTEQGPTAVARELLGEIAQPALRDIKVEFKGVKVARVYPESLANVPAGSQQILLGRYLPEGKDQTGEVIVTGTQGGKPVRFTTRIALKDAEHGNSFIPRLWARMHLDSLLEQGASATIKDEIISLSEEYQIITPYTSFLVLETDADRERFKVKRRFQMRDGERFFADGRDNAVFDLTQKQMKRASNWRTALRRSVLGELARLGRDARLFQPPSRYKLAKARLAELADDMDVLNEERLLAEPGKLGDLDGADVYAREEFGVPDLAFKDEQGGENYFLGVDEKRELSGKSEELAYRTDPAGLPEPLPDPWGFDQDKDLALAQVGSLSLSENESLRALEFRSVNGLMGEPGWYADGRWGGRGRGPSFGHWLNTLFPPLAAPARPTKAPKSTWPAAAHELANSLVRMDKLAKLAGGLEIQRQTDTFNVRWNELSARSRRLELASAKAWLTRSSSDGGQTLISWCDAKEIGVYSAAFQLGRTRTATPNDVQPPPLELHDYSMASLEREYAEYTPTLEKQAKDRTLLILKYDANPDHETRFLIDTERHVVLSIESRHQGKSSGLTKFEDFVEIAGTWWAQRIETLDADGKRQSLTTQTIKALTDKDFEKRVSAELAGRGQVQFLHQPLPSVASAKKAAATGKADFDDQFVLLLHFHMTQQWPRVLDHLGQCEKLAVNKPGLRWLRSALLRDSRRHEELRQRYLEDLARLVKTPPIDAYFLAEYVQGQASGVLETNEMLALLQSLRPIYEKQPPHVQAMKQWQQQQINYVNQAGRTDEALRLWKEHATDYARDYYVQAQYARALASAGEYPAAYAWLTNALAKGVKWLDYEDDYLRDTYAQLLRQEGRYDELVKYAAAWVERNPRGGSAYQHYLGALLRTDRIAEADALAARWLKDAQIPGELPPPVASRLDAAVQFLLGNAYGFYTNRIEERWLAPLGEAALFFVRHKTHPGTSDQIMGNQHFRRSEEASRVRKKFADILTKEIAQLPAEQVQRLVGRLDYDDLAPAAWEKLAAALRERWDKEAKENVKQTLGATLVTVLSRMPDSTELTSFLRVQWQKAPEKWRADYASQLFNHLLYQPWTVEHENEALSLLDKLSTSEDAGARLFASVAALYRLTDRLVENRITAATKKLEHLEKLTRTELLKKQDEIRRQAREGVADRLRKEAAQHKALGQWLLAESIYLDVLLDRNLKQAATDAWGVVGVSPSKKTDDEPTLERALGEMLRQRQFVVLMNLASRKSTEPALVERVLKYIEQGVNANAPRWKPVNYRLLVALDRTKELEQVLNQWAHQDDPDNRWRVALGYLLAEQGKLADAIREFEAVEAADELGPEAYRSLSDWYLANNQRDKHEQAALAVYKTMSEHRLNQMLQVKLQPWHNPSGHLPTELDKEVLRQFAVLFDKSAWPQNYLYTLQQFYRASHDFRLLSGLPDAVVGHTAARIYPFVQNMDSVLSEVRDEATADEIVQRIAAVRPRAKTDVDKRALDMLEVLVERRAAEVQNQPGPHVKNALAALVRASKGKWSPGEPRLMADFLASLGKITQKPLADEQLRQFKLLHDAEEKRGSADRLHISYQHAQTLHRYERRADAIDLLQTALDEFQAANDGVLPRSADNALDYFVRLLEEAGHFARGEKVLQAQLAHPVNGQQRYWLIERLDRLYLHALERSGDVSLGKGEALYHALNAKLQKDLQERDHDHRYQLTSVLCQVYRVAHNQKFKTVVADVRGFAFEILPPILKVQTNNYDSMVSLVAHTVRDLIGPREGVEFLLDRIDSEPRWLRYNNQDAWARHGSNLAEWRRQARDLGAAEGRLLKVVLAELRRELETRESRNRSMYHLQADRERFWKEKAADFAKTAEVVLAERNKSGATAQYIAEYFYWGLDQPKRAIEVLFAAHQQKLLDEEGQGRLVEYLHLQKRFAESIPVLVPMVERRPANLDYRVKLMRSYFHAGKKADLLALLKASDEYFHQKDRWGEGPLERLANITLETELYDQSVAYFKELIPLHERSHANRGIGNGTLASYYVGLANAYAGLKKTPEAVDAAGGAVVAWGTLHEMRGRALETLKNVLVKSPDLDAFVAHFDKQEQDSAIIRKGIGQAYMELKEYAKAIKQLERAAAQQPNDVETFQLLVQCYDRTEDREGAIRQLLQAIQLSRRELKLYEDLGKRYADLKQPELAERAYTSIVEMQPTESESHALLAEVREKQERWPEAIAQWERVASLRALEPTGLLKLAAAQIHEKQFDQARESLHKLSSRNWPPRFGDVQDEVRKLERKLPERSK